MIASFATFPCVSFNRWQGVELGGAIKNVVALAAGMCEGLGLGMNAMSSLVTRGCMEMGRMGKLFGADQETFNGLAGVGDTFGTCLGPLSRNR
jgi:glycerol-3-phosphate dehydrogenase